MIDIEGYISEGIIFSLNDLDCEHFIKGPSLFKDVTEEARHFYIEAAAKNNAIIAQFADELNGIKKPYQQYLDEAKEAALSQHVYVVLDKNTSLYEFWKEMQKYSYDMNIDSNNSIEVQVIPMFLWCKGIRIDFDLLDDIQ